MHRRDVLKSSAAVAGVTVGKQVVESVVAPGLQAATAAEPEPVLPTRRVDTNASLFAWPFRRLPFERVADLVATYSELGFTEVWAGSFEAIFHRDLRAVNARLAAVCDKHDMLRPIGAANPTLPDWQEDVRRCAQVHGMHGIRLLPNYHQYSLDDPRLASLVELAGSLGLLIQIATTLEDRRTQHELVQVDDVPLEPLGELCAKFPQVPFQLLNLRPAGGALPRPAQAANVWCDSARVDSTDGIRKLIESTGGRVVFGSHAPLLIPQAALIRLGESGLRTSQLERLLSSGPRELTELSSRPRPGAARQRGG